MRIHVLFAGAVLLSGGTAFGQDNGPAPIPMAADGVQPAHHHHRYHHRHYAHHTPVSSGIPGDTERPIDKGPDTPAANQAYQGGGVILQGAPGAPPPVPRATPPGQVPAGSVPP